MYISDKEEPAFKAFKNTSGFEIKKIFIEGKNTWGVPEKFRGKKIELKSVRGIIELWK